MIDPTKTTPEKLAEMNDSLIIDNNHLRYELKTWKNVFGHLGTADECGNEWIKLKDEVEQLRKALTRALVEAEGWCDEATGHQPKDIMGYDGWHDEAEALLK